MIEQDVPAAQPDPSTPIDAQAVAHQLKRLSRASVPPWLHADVARRMADRLPYIKMQPSTVLQWQAWWGASHEPLAQQYPQAQHLWLESEPSLRERCLQQLRRPWWQRWSSVRQPEVLGPVDVKEGAAQLLWSNMVLHAGPARAATLRAWHRALAVDGFVMFSCLGPDSLRELRPLYAAMHWGDPLPQWPDMHDLGDMLVEAGFTDPVMDQERVDLTWADPGSLLRDLRALGGNAAPERFAGLRTPRWRQVLLQVLERLRAPDGRLHLTLELVYGHAIKAAPRFKVEAQTTVSLDAMRKMVRKSGRSS